MDKVFLRVYNREIDKMIEGGHLDEAVAHCQHILKTYPMYIETYRLLGKAYLEARRYSDAADIFQRILNAVPDDFISHVGMSIICDDEHKLDDAIWHMERAYEVQPSNSAIQGELRRLYGKRDGVDPSSIRLSRVALANMYLQGELFNQAIAEIRSVLAENPNRPDLQVILLRAFYRAGQKVEASEVAAALLKKYPNCMDALRVMVDVLPGSGSAENAQAYRQQLLLLDPYAGHALDSAFSSHLVPDSAVVMERLGYRSEVELVAQTPDTTSSLGIKSATEKQTDLPPDWMQNPVTGEPSAVPAPITPDTVLASDTAADSVPDLTPTVDKQVSTEISQDILASTGEELPEKPIEKGDFPEWLMPMTTSEVSTQAANDHDAPDQPLPANVDEIPEFLGSIVRGGAAKDEQIEPQKPAEPEPTAGIGVPEFLKSVTSPEEIKDENKEPEKLVEDQLVSEEDISDWFNSVPPAEDIWQDNFEPEKPGEHLPLITENVPDLDKSTPPAEESSTMNIVPESVPAGIPATESEPEPTPTEVKPLEEKAFPDWLIAIGAGVVGDIAIDSGVVLEGLSAQQGAIPEDLLSETQKRSEEIPEELSQPFEQPDETLISPVQEPLRSLNEVQPNEPLSTLDKTAPAAVPLRGTFLGGEDAAESEVLPAPGLQAQVSGALSAFEERLSETPDDFSEEVLSAQEETPLTVLPAEETVQPDVRMVSGEDATMAWLEQLSADQGTKLEEPLASSEGGLEQKSDQTQEITDDQPAVPKLEEVYPTIAEPVIDEKVLPIPPWLDKVDVEEMSGTNLTETPDMMQSVKTTEEMPGWLSETEEPVPANESPKASDDFPEWLLHPAQSAESGSTPAPEEPAWVDENVPITEQTVPTMPEEWVPIETKQTGPEPDLADETKSNLQLHQVFEPETAEETPDAIEQKQVSELKPEADEEVSEIVEPVTAEEVLEVVEPKQVIEPMIVEDVPEVLEQLQVVEPITIVKAPAAIEQKQVAERESMTAEDVPEVIEQKQVVEPETAGEVIEVVEPKKVIEPLKAEEVPEVVEPLQIVEPETAEHVQEVVETEQVVGPMKADTVQGVVEPKQVIEPEVPPAGIEPKQVVESSTTEEAPAIIEQKQIVEPEPAVESRAISQPAPAIEPVSISVGKPLQPASLKQTGMLSEIPSEDVDADLLSNAQTVLDQNSLDEAIKHYSKLIKKGRLLPEVIHDLREAIIRYPTDVNIWQTLGDAYMRANRLQDALDAYTKAEELLR